MRYNMIGSALWLNCSGMILMGIYTATSRCWISLSYDIWLAWGNLYIFFLISVIIMTLCDFLVDIPWWSYLLLVWLVRPCICIVQEVDLSKHILYQHSYMLYAMPIWLSWTGVWLLYGTYLSYTSCVNSVFCTLLWSIWCDVGLFYFDGMLLQHGYMWLYILLGYHVNVWRRWCVQLWY